MYIYIHKQTINIYIKIFLAIFSSNKIFPRIILIFNEERKNENLDIKRKILNPLSLSKILFISLRNEIIYFFDFYFPDFYVLGEKIKIGHQKGKF